MSALVRVATQEHIVEHRPSPTNSRDLGLESSVPLGPDMPKKAQGTKLSVRDSYLAHTGMFQRGAV